MFYTVKLTIRRGDRTMAIASLKLKEYINYATPTEEGVINFILKHPKKTSQMTIYQLAEATYASPSTIIRLCKKIGYQGYKDFLKDLIYEQAFHTNYRKQDFLDLEKTDEVQDIIHKVTHRNVLGLEEAQELLDSETIEQVISILFASKKIIIFGIGASQLVAKDAFLKFTRINKTALVSEDSHTQILMAKNMTADDVALVISYSGQTKEMIQCSELAKRNGATVISITNTNPSPINQLADYAIYIPTIESSLRSGAMSSRISQLNVIDILFMSFINKIHEESIEILEKTQIQKEGK